MRTFWPKRTNVKTAEQVETENAKFREMRDTQYYKGYHGMITAFATPDKKVWESIRQKGTVIRITRWNDCTSITIRYSVGNGRSLTRTLYI